MMIAATPTTLQTTPTTPSSKSQSTLSAPTPTPSPTPTPTSPSSTTQTTSTTPTVSLIYCGVVTNTPPDTRSPTIKTTALLSCVINIQQLQLQQRKLRCHQQLKQGHLKQLGSPEIAEIAVINTAYRTLHSDTVNAVIAPCQSPYPQ